MSCAAPSCERAESCLPNATPLAVQCVAVMRHTIREDECIKDWALTASRPWDPPISKEGVGLVSKGRLSHYYSTFTVLNGLNPFGSVPLHPSNICRWEQLVQICVSTASRR